MVLGAECMGGVDFEPWLSSLSGLSGPVGALSGPCRGPVGLTALTAVEGAVGGCRGLSWMRGL